MATTSPGAPQAAPTSDEPKPTSWRRGHDRDVSADGDERPAARTWWAAALEWVCVLCADLDD